MVQRCQEPKAKAALPKLSVIGWPEFHLHPDPLRLVQRMRLSLTRCITETRWMSLLPSAPWNSKFSLQIELRNLRSISLMIAQTRRKERKRLYLKSFRAHATLSQTEHTWSCLLLF